MLVRRLTSSCVTVCLCCSAESVNGSAATQRCRAVFLTAVAAVPKWINAITALRRPWHSVPPPAAIVLMPYWLLLSGEPDLRCHAAYSRHTPSTLSQRFFPHHHLPLSVNPQSIFTVLWSDYSASWLDTPLSGPRWKSGEARSGWRLGSGRGTNTLSLILNAQSTTRRVKKIKGKTSLWAF